MLSLKTFLIFSIFTSVLFSHSKDELIFKLKELNKKIDTIYKNSTILSKSNSYKKQITDIKNRIYLVKKKLETLSNDLDNPVYFNNNIYLDLNKASIHLQDMGHLTYFPGLVLIIVHGK